MIEQINGWFVMPAPEWMLWLILASAGLLFSWFIGAAFSAIVKSMQEDEKR